MKARTGSALSLLALALALQSRAADIPGSKDPAGMKRYTGSEIIGYHAPKFDEFLLPLGPPTRLSPPAYAKSLKTEGLISRYTYLAPAGRTPAELFRNYQLEFQRLGLTPLYQKGAGERDGSVPRSTRRRTRINSARSWPTTRARSAFWSRNRRSRSPPIITSSSRAIGTA